MTACRDDRGRGTVAEDARSTGAAPAPGSASPGPAVSSLGVGAAGLIGRLGRTRRRLTVWRRALAVRPPARGRVLVVSSDPVFRGQVAWLVTARRLAVVEADYRLASLPLPTAPGSDAIIFDVRMPTMEAVEVVGWLSRRYPRVPTALVSPGMTLEVLRVSIDRLAVATVHRPLGPGELLARLLVFADLLRREGTRLRGGRDRDRLLDLFLARVGPPSRRTAFDLERLRRGRRRLTWGLVALLVVAGALVASTLLAPAPGSRGAREPSLHEMLKAGLRYLDRDDRRKTQPR